MKPRVFFVIRTAFVLLGASVLVLLIVLIGSALIVASHRNGSYILFSFGPRGWYEFLGSLPWLVVGLVGILIVIAEVLGWYGTKVYRRPIMYSAIGLVSCVAALSIILAETPFHEYMIVHRFPVLSPLYDELDAHTPTHAYFGALSATTSDHWTLRLPNGDLLTVTLGPDTRFPNGDDFMLSDTLIVLGDRDDATVTARGIRKVNRTDLPRVMRMPHLAPR